MQISPHDLWNEDNGNLLAIEAHGTHCDRLIESVFGQKREKKMAKEKKPKQNKQQRQIFVIDRNCLMKSFLSTRLLRFLYVTC